MRLLLISNSTNAGEAYLEYPKYHIKDFLGDRVSRVLFIPYAGVTFSHDEYAEKVGNRFNEIGYDIDSIHKYKDPVEAVKNAEAIAVGGGNTFRLLQMMQQNDLINAIREKVLSGTPYMGWSAGSNMACPTIRTTNDMPIVQPESFNALNLVKFQINPHYLDAHPDGHAGETREARIEEFLELNSDIFVVGLREGTMFRIEDSSIKLLGAKPARIFRKGDEAYDLKPEDDFRFLL